MKRRFKEFIKGNILHSMFSLGQRAGIDFLPRHFYSEIPDLHQLRNDESWKTPFSPEVRGWDDLDAQETFARDVLGQWRGEVTEIHERACEMAGERGFGPVEATALYSFLMKLRPPQIVQVGGGVSTAVMMMCDKYRPQIISVDPYPIQFLRDCKAKGWVELWDNPAQQIIPKISCAVGRMPVGSLLFIDSTHALGPAGEVTRLVCEVLPRLAGGSYAHFHDIHFPYDYSRHTMSRELFFQHESPLLMAFLSANDRFEIAASLSMLHYDRPSKLATIFHGYTPQQNDAGLSISDGHFPSSCYLRCLA